ncbi:MAG TPA: 2-oxoglutarate dehydrogenase, E2 component, dihydrolipoamide succinyltransferase [Terriglobales bacterium]|nr:2-oxoglutarate dehydrogenase, E2 component, dihydrolipoamide succinyltransferase [Terriglobales bacterium]
MPTDVIMPQMGESIVEGTITKWLKKPGEKVQRDEPLFEISTDKVDAEIPSPTSGVLQEIKVSEGTTVQVNTVVASIAAEGEAAAAAAPEKASPPSKAAVPAAQPAERKAVTAPPPKLTPPRAAPQTEARPSEAVAEHKETVLQFPQEREEERVRSSPLVRRIARDNNLDLSQVPGSGLGGRITKQDVLAFLEKGPVAAPTRPGVAASGAATAQAVAPVAIPGEVVPMTQMRKIIAQRMVESRRTSAHVHNLFEVDMTRIVNLRNKLKNSFEQRYGARLTFMPFFVRAAIIALQQFPIINASLEGDNIHYHRNINVGIAVALDWGLIVPVLKNAEEKNFLGLQRGITDLGERARNKRLMPDEIQGSTFTITNPGSFGAVFGLPIINQPNVAILGVGGIAKAPVVVTDTQGNDSIAIRSLVHLTLGYDHRVIDGAVADQFMALLKKTLESWSEEIG